MKLNDGYQTLISFAEDASVNFWEKSVTPPGLDGGDEIDTTTMHNEAWRTRYPRSLVTATESTFRAAYDPVVYDEILAMLNVNQLITITFPDGSTLAFWGWIKNFQPGELVEGEQPEADVTVVPSNENDSQVETAPNYTAAP